MNDAVRFPSLSELRERRSAKWTQYDAGVLPMPVAEMDCLLAEPIAQTLIDAVRRGDTGYPPMDGVPSHAFAEFAADTWGWAPDSRRCVLSSDVSVAGIAALRTLVPDGSAVAISSPVYPPFFAWPGRAGMTLVDVPLLGADRGYALDLAGLERAFADGVRGYVLCHPHNPVGRLVPEDELAALADLAQRYDVLVVADEIHAPLTLPGQEFTPYLTVSEAARATGVALHSPSKAWNLAGLKAAFLVYEDPRFDEPLAGQRHTLPWNAGHFGALAAVPAYRESREWLAALRGHLADNHAPMCRPVATGPTRRAESWRWGGWRWASGPPSGPPAPGMCG